MQFNKIEFQNQDGNLIRNLLQLPIIFLRQTVSYQSTNCATKCLHVPDNPPASSTACPCTVAILEELKEQTENECTRTNKAREVSVAVAQSRARAEETRVVACLCFAQHEWNARQESQPASQTRSKWNYSMSYTERKPLAVWRIPSRDEFGSIGRLVYLFSRKGYARKVGLVFGPRLCVWESRSWYLLCIDCYW